MKIAIDALTVKSLYHGMGIYITNLLKQMVSDSTHSFIIYNKCREFEVLSKNNEKVELQNVKKSKVLRILWEYLNLPTLLKQEKVNVFWGPSNFLPLKKVCKYVVTIHDLSSFTHAQTYPFARRNYYQYIIRQAVKRADLIVTDSLSSQKDLTDFFSVPKDKIKVIYCGVDDMFQPLTSTSIISQVKEQYHLPSNFILTLGVLEPKKNTDRLIKAYAAAKKQYFNLPQLVIAGSIKYGWSNKNIFKLVKQYNLAKDVIFTGSIKHIDLPALYSTAKLFILPSLFEGFGLPVIEAMACGTPVITSNVSSLPEVAGDAGILINPYDTEAISQTMIKVLSDKTLQKDMRTKGFENVKRFSWKNSAKELIGLFEEVANKQ
jgi:glycosyltransferase involved in cell wall biosynthesis